MGVVAENEKIIEGYCVLLSCRDSEVLLQVQDVNGCRIRLDDLVKSIEYL